MEKQLNETIQTARATTDKVTGRKYAADSGAAVVLDARTGRVVSMASQPTYDPKVWSGGITSKQLKRLYSEKAGTPLLSRATQGQFAPGSTWKPMMTAGALENGFGTDTSLPCSSGFQVGNRVFKNYESGSYGNIGFAKALEVSCNTFFYRIGYNFWQKYGTDVADVSAKDPLVSMAKKFGFGKTTGIDIPGEASGRIADRRWKLAYWKSMKDYYCKVGKEDGNDFLHRFAREFCLEGYAYRAGDAVNFAIGQGDTVVTPLQLARAYGAIANGGTLYEPRVAKAIVSPEGKLIKSFPPKVQGKVPVKKGYLDYIDNALKGVSRTGTMSWRLGRLPSGRGDGPGQDRVGRGLRQAEHLVGRVLHQGLRRGDDGQPGRHRFRYVGTGDPQDLGAPLRHRRSRRAALEGRDPRHDLPEELPTFARDGSILPPARKEQKR